MSAGWAAVVLLGALVLWRVQFHPQSPEERV